MKEAWIVYEHDSNFDIGYNPNQALIIFHEPWQKWKYALVQRIVFAELK